MIRHGVMEVHRTLLKNWEMRVKRGLRKTLCLQIEGVSKRYDRAYMGKEMTTLGTLTV